MNNIVDYHYSTNQTGLNLRQILLHNQKDPEAMLDNPKYVFYDVVKPRVSMIE